MKIHNTATRLPYNLFKTVCVDGDLTLLVIEGEASEAEMQDAWQSICDGYSNALGASDNKHLLSLIKQVGFLTADYKSVMLLLDQLESAGEVRLFADKVNEILNTKFAFDATDIEKFDEDVAACRSRAGELGLNLELKSAQLDAVQKKMQKGGEGKFTDEYFIRLETAIGNHVKYQIDFDKINTYEFAIRLKQLNDSLKN